MSNEIAPLAGHYPCSSSTRPGGNGGGNLATRALVSAKARYRQMRSEFAENQTLWELMVSAEPLAWIGKRKHVSCCRSAVGPQLFAMIALESSIENPHAVSSLDNR